MLAVVVAAGVELAAELELELDELLELEPHPASATRISGNATADSRFMRWVSCSGSSASERNDAGKKRKLPAARSAWERAYWVAELRLVAMSGHSKWASIKHKKAVVDQRRGQHFTKLARAISVAAREGGGDPDGNPALALAIQKARDASMPKDNIERAIAKGTGEGVDTEQIETVLYEGYGPGGVALLIEALTDNRNRTGADVRHALSKHGGSLGEPGSVSYLFDKQGVIVVDAARYGEDDLMGAIDAGAQDIVLDDDVYEILTDPSDLGAVRAALEQSGVELESADVTQRPRVRVPVGEAEATKLMKLIDALEESDDVGAVHANFDVDADVLERIAG